MLNARRSNKDSTAHGSESDVIGTLRSEIMASSYDENAD